MFSDRRALGPGDQRGFKPHTAHFFPWLRHSLKPQHSGDLGLNGPYKCSAEPHGNLTPLERAKELIQGKERERKGELHCNGVGLARRLPVVLRGHPILPGSLAKRREDSPARWNRSPERDPDSDAKASPEYGPQDPGDTSASARDYNSEGSAVRNHRSHLNVPLSRGEGTGTPVRKYGPPLAPAAVPAAASPGKFKGQELNCEAPVVMCAEEGREDLWHYARHTYQQRDPHSSSRLKSAAQGLTDRQQGFRSSFSSTKEQGRNSQSQKDLTGLKEPPVDGFKGPSSLHGVIFSTEVPQRGMGCSRTLQGSRKPRPSSARITTRGQNQTWVQPRPTSGEESQNSRKGAGHPEPRCSRKVVHNQIKRVVDNLEKVLGALKDVHHEMKEVVEQIDYLTSSIDLKEEEQEQEGGGGGGGDGAKPPYDSSSSSGSSSSSSSSGVTVDPNRQRPSDRGDQPGSTEASANHRRGYPLNYTRSLSPASVPPHIQNTVLSSEEIPTFQVTRSLGTSLNQCRTPSHTHNPPSSASSAKTGSLLRPQNPASQNLAPSPYRSSSLPVRPPTPGLSPLTVNLQHPNSTPGGSPGPHPRSPGTTSPVRVGPVSPLSPVSPQPPPALVPSVIIETKGGSHRTSHGDHPSASPLSPSTAHPPSPDCPPRESETVPRSDGERQASSAGPDEPAPRECATLRNTTKGPLVRGHRGRKPPPYPHNRPFECTKKAKEPREAPPYPEKRRLLSTTV